MSNVSISIGGRRFTVACAPGEEGHITGLGRMIDNKLAAMGGASGQSESRMLLFACLLLADEVHDLKSRLPQPSLFPESGASASEAPSSAIAERLEKLAHQMENLAASLEA